jgi:hypothetical protein
MTVLQFIFADLAHFGGTVVLIFVIGMVVEAIVVAFANAIRSGRS